MPLHQPDYELHGFEPADDGHQQHYEDLDISSFKVLGEYRTYTDAYFVLLDEGATYGIPGSPQLRAVHVSRDLRARTFEVDSKELPLYAMAQSYLIARGCPSDALDAPEGVHDPADDRTRALEARVRGDGDHFALLASYTDDMRDPVQTVVMLRSLTPGGAGIPDPAGAVRLGLQQPHPAGRWVRDLRRSGRLVGGMVGRGGPGATAAGSDRTPQPGPDRPGDTRAAGLPSASRTLNTAFAEPVSADRRRAI